MRCGGDDLLRTRVVPAYVIGMSGNYDTVGRRLE